MQVRNIFRNCLKQHFIGRTLFTKPSQFISVKELKSNRINPKTSPAYSLLIIPATAFCLGCWQVQRRKWKLNLMKEMEEKTSAPAIDLPADLNELEFLEYHNVKVKGSFDHDNEMYISPRQELGMQESGDRGGIVSTSQGIGSHVITPFVISEGFHKGVKILINRGWVPLKKQDPETRQSGQISGEFELTGAVRHTDKGMYLAENDNNSKIWQSRDVYGLAEKMDTLPIFLDASLESSVEGGPIGGQTRVNLRNEHMSYLVTWYSLSLLTGVLWWIKYKRPIKGRS